MIDRKNGFFRYETATQAKTTSEENTENSSLSIEFHRSLLARSKIQLNYCSIILQSHFKMAKTLFLTTCKLFWTYLIFEDEIWSTTYPRMHVRRVFRGQSTASLQKYQLVPLQTHSWPSFRIDWLHFSCAINYPTAEIVLNQSKIRRKSGSRIWFQTWSLNRIESLKINKTYLEIVLFRCSLSCRIMYFAGDSLEWIHFGIINFTELLFV